MGVVGGQRPHGVRPADDVTLDFWDREEKQNSTPGGFSPPQPGVTNSLCWEANVITFNNSNVLGSLNFANVPTDFENGWLDIGFFPDTITGAIHTLPNDATIVTDIFANSSGGAATYVGLPVVGVGGEPVTNNRVTS